MRKRKEANTDTEAMETYSRIEERDASGVHELWRIQTGMDERACVPPRGGEMENQRDSEAAG